MLLSNSISLLKITRSNLSKEFDMTDLGPVHYLHGIQILRNRTKKTIFLSQQRYLQNILGKFGMLELKPIDSPMDPGLKLSKYMSPLTITEISDMKNYPYHWLIGSLMYAMVCTWPDLAYTISTLSQFMSNLEIQHWKALIRVTKYIQATKNQVICCESNQLLLYFCRPKLVKLAHSFVSNLSHVWKRVGLFQ